MKSHTKTVTRYVTEDGAEFDTPEKATAHEILVERIRQIMEPLKIPDDKQALIDAHKGHWQHDLETVYAAREGILQICRDLKMHETYPCFNAHGRNAHPLSMIGRILDDAGRDPLNDAWRRFAKIDPQGREYEQCFYAYTAGESERATFPCLNP